MPRLTDQVPHPLKPLCEQWLSLLEETKKIKEERFGKYARECMKFFDSAHDWMWHDDYARAPGGFLDKTQQVNYPVFRMTLNRVFEAVALLGPALLHKYPNVNVEAVEHPNIDRATLLSVSGPLGQQQALRLRMFDQYQMPYDQMGQLLQRQYEQRALENEMNYQRKKTIAQMEQFYANWLQVEAGKKKEARRSISEAIIKGMGCLFTEMYRPRGSQIRYPKSRHISVDQILKDPDACYPEDVQWYSITWIHPVNLVERKYGIPAGELVGQLQSVDKQTSLQGRRDARSGKKDAGSHDLLEYYEIYSKNGFGHRLKTTKKSDQINFDEFGDFTRLVVAKGVPYPLNMPSWELGAPPDELFDRAQWPIPFWMDEGTGNGWPVTELSFYDKPGSIWPVSLFKPVIGLMRFVNWCFSFLADKVASASHDYIAVFKSAAKSIQEQIYHKTGPYTIVEIEELFAQHGLRGVIDFLQPPPFQADIWKMVSEAMELIDKGTGLTELIYGLTGVQMRSALEANIRDEHIAIRPDDMAEKTEDWYSETALKEIEAAVWMLEREDIEPLMGPVAAAVFEQYVLQQDPDEVIRDYSYRVQAGSARKPNKSTRIANLNEFGRFMGPLMQMFAQGGQPGPWNAYVRRWGQANDISDIEEFLIPAPAQPAVPSETSQEEERQEERHEQEMAHRQEQHDQELQFATAKTRLELQALRAKARGDNGR
jgi:hypothetical protein